MKASSVRSAKQRSTVVWFGLVCFLCFIWELQKGMREEENKQPTEIDGCRKRLSKIHMKAC